MAMPFQTARVVSLLTELSSRAANIHGEVAHSYRNDGEQLFGTSRELVTHITPTVASFGAVFSDLSTSSER